MLQLAAEHFERPSAASGLASELAGPARVAVKMSPSEMYLGRPRVPLKEAIGFLYREL